jgi:hypothetical protein
VGEYLKGALMAKELGVSPAYLSQLKSKGDYRVVYDKIRKKYKKTETIKRFEGSGAGEKSILLKGRNCKQKGIPAKQKADNGKSNTVVEPNTKPKANNPSSSIPDLDNRNNDSGNSDIEDMAWLVMEEKKERIRKLRIDNEKEEGKLVYVDELESLWFKYFRLVRDEVLKVAKSESDQAVGKTAHEIEMIYTDALKFVLTNLPEDPPKLKG